MADTLLHTSAQSQRPNIAFGKIFQMMLAVRAERRALAALDATALADLGLTRADQAAESARAPWNVPAHWLNTGKRQ